MQNNNGVLTQGMKMARVCTSGDSASKVLIQDMDVNFLTHDKEGDDISKDISKSLEMILQRNPSIHELRRLFRNINIMCYCNGDLRVNEAISKIKGSLKDKGYSEAEIESLLKEIVVFSFAKQSEFNPAVTSFTFIDVNDVEAGVSQELIQNVANSKSKENPEGITVVSNDNHSTILFAGNGEHTIKYMNKEGTVSCLIADLVTSAIEESRNSNQKREKSTETKDYLAELHGMLQRIENGENTETLMEEIEGRVYLGLHHANEGELLLNSEADRVAKKLLILELPEDNERVENYKKDRSKLIKSAASFLTKDQLEYILNPKSTVTSQKDFSDNNRAQLIELFQSFSEIKKAKHVSVRDKVQFMIPHGMDANDPNVMLIEDMIDRQEEKASSYNKDMDEIQHISEVVNGIVSRLVSICPSDVLAKIAIKYDPSIKNQYEYLAEKEERE